jgi:hypothetical protein
MRAFGLLGVVIVLGVGLYLYQQNIKEFPDENPVQTIDTIAIRQRLLTIGQTERTYQATNGKYATLEELAAADLLPGGTQQRGYTYTANVSATSFTITATPTAEDKEGWPTLTINETMQVTEQ